MVVPCIKKQLRETFSKLNRLKLSSDIHSRKSFRTLRNESGLTLVEIIVVLIILSILIAFLTGGLFDTGERAKVKLNSIMMNKVKSFIDQYQLQYNQLPSSLASLTACDQVTGAQCVPIAKAEDIKDAWGTNLVYTVEQGGRAYKLKSLGADRKEGGEAASGDAVIEGP
jgi:general secretion pathway protein G